MNTIKKTIIKVEKARFEELQKHLTLMTFEEHKKQGVDYCEFDENYFYVKYNNGYELCVFINSGDNCYWCNMELYDEDDNVICLEEDCDLKENMKLTYNNVDYKIKFELI